MTPELVSEALSYIPPDVDRDTWVRVGMAIKSELGDSAFDLWSEWSAASESYKLPDARDAWRSFKPGGRVKIGTLFGLAKDHGFKFPERASGPADPVAIAAAQAEQQRLAAKRKAEQETEAARYRERADKAAKEARRLWADCSEKGSSPYLERKRVGAHGVRFGRDGLLVVPMLNAAGELQNVQRISAEKPVDGSDKKFMFGGRKTGLFHVCGPALGPELELVLLAEGYATAATLHEATMRTVVVAFDAGNLVHVAKELGTAAPAARVLVCADNDQVTEAATGRNTGKHKAEQAARAVRAAGGVAAVLLPEGFGAAGGTDFNDLAIAVGVDAVRRTVEAAAQQLLDQPRPAAKSCDSGAIGGGDGGQGQPPDRGGASTPPSDEPPPDWDPFHVDARGVWHTARDVEGNRKKPMWLCTPLEVSARTRGDDANGWGYLLEFADPDGNAKQWAMPAAMLSGDGTEWAGRLRDMGLRMATGPASRALIARYVDTRNPADRVTCTDRVGWHGSTYVLPSGSIGGGEGSKRFVFQSETGMENTFRRRGELQAWQRDVAALCVGNSRLVFAVCCAFAGPMLRPANVEGGGFHFRGISSIGKTTGLRVAASVWGSPAYMQRWRTTDNALEATAVQHCDGLLILDEIGQMDARVLGESAYMLANGQEKGRSTRSGLARRKRTWLTLFLSTGETSMADQMAEAGKRSRAGQEVRMLDVPLDAGAGMGGIEQLHEFDTAAEISDAIVAEAGRQYGTAGFAWLEWACENHHLLPARLQVLVDRFRNELVPVAASEQVRRAGTRFALVAAAGDLATQAGVTGWPEGEAMRGVRKCFAAWLGSRGHMDNGENVAMLRQVRHFLELNGELRFGWFHRALEDHKPNTPLRAGFRRLVDGDGKPVRNNSDYMREYGQQMTAADAEESRCEYFVLTEVFKREVCKGFEPDAVAALLRNRGHLAHDPDRLQKKQRLPGMDKVWCYHLLPSVFSGDDV
ncbi:MAG: DUF927 domain-containing protein [Caldimonas sp.]